MLTVSRLVEPKVNTNTNLSAVAVQCSAVVAKQSSMSSPPIGLDLDNRLGLGLC